MSRLVLPLRSYHYTPHFPIDTFKYLQGYYKYIPDGDDTARINLRTWGKGQYKSNDNFYLSAASNWTFFAFPINYYTSPIMADSAGLIFYSGKTDSVRGPNSSLYLDNLELVMQPKSMGINAINELFWMRKNKNDFEVINNFIKKNKKFLKAQNLLSKTFSDMNVDSFPTKTTINKVLKNYAKSLNEIETLEQKEINKTKIFLKEINRVILYLHKRDIKGLQSIIKKSKYLFKGNSGIRHVDYIGIKN